jgi:hypothetical protein
MKTNLSAVCMAAALLLTMAANAASYPLKTCTELYGEENPAARVTLISSAVRHQLQLRYHAAANFECCIVIYDGGGKQILMLCRTVSKGENLLKIDLHRLIPAGVYQLKVYGAETEAALRFVKQ